MLPRADDRRGPHDVAVDQRLLEREGKLPEPADPERQRRQRVEGCATRPHPGEELRVEGAVDHPLAVAQHDGCAAQLEEARQLAQGAPAALARAELRGEGVEGALQLRP